MLISEKNKPLAKKKSDKMSLYNDKQVISREYNNFNIYATNIKAPKYIKQKPNIHWKDFWWSSNTLSTWCEEPTHWKRPWCWERQKTGGEGDDRGLDGWMASPIQWTWVWASSRRWWRTGKPGVLQSMGSQSWTWLSNWTITDLKGESDDNTIIVEDFNTKLSTINRSSSQKEKKKRKYWT